MSKEESYFKLSKNNYSDLSNQCDWIEKTITNRISDLSNVKTMQGERDAFCYYRKLIQELHGDLTQFMEEQTTKL